MLLLALKAVCGRRSSAPLGETDVLLLRSRRRRRRSGRGRRSGGRGGCFCRCRFFLLPLPRSPEPSFHAWHQHVASASARRGGSSDSPKPHGRHRTHFPSGPSSRPVLGVQADARCPAGGRRSQTLAALLLRVAFRQARDRTALFCRGRRNRNTIRNTRGDPVAFILVGLLPSRTSSFRLTFRSTVSSGCDGAFGEPVRPHRFAHRGVQAFFPPLRGLEPVWATRSLGAAIILPPATSGQRRASATHPTRLETRTEESWPFASRRGPID